jgi:hypothetical protein
MSSVATVWIRYRDAQPWLVLEFEHLAKSACSLETQGRLTDKAVAALINSSVHE